MLDYAKFILHSDCPAFKNDTRRGLGYTLSGSVYAGANVVTIQVTLRTDPDFVDLQFNGNSLSGLSVLPSTSWRRKGSIYMYGNNAPDGYVNYPVQFDVYWSVGGAELVVKLIYIQQFVSTLTLTPSPFNIVFADYSHT